MRSAPGVSLVSAVLQKSLSQAQSRFNLSNPGSLNKKKLFRERKEQRKLQQKLKSISQGNQLLSTHQPPQSYSLVDFKSQLHTPLSFDFEPADDQFDTFIQDIKKKYTCLNSTTKPPKASLPKLISLKLKKKGEKKKLKKLEKLLHKKKVSLLKEEKRKNKEKSDVLVKDCNSSFIGPGSESKSLDPTSEKPQTLLQKLRLQRLEARKRRKQLKKEAKLQLEAQKLNQNSKPKKRMLSNSDDVDSGRGQSSSPPIVTAKLTFYSNGDGESNVKSKLVNGNNGISKNLSPGHSIKSASVSSKPSATCNGISSLKSCPKLPEPRVTLFAREKVHNGWRRKSPTGVGFINMGNSCYMNATLQALFHTPALFNWLIEDDEHKSRCQSNHQYYSQCMVCAMQGTLRESIKSPICIRPQLIHNKLKLICKHFIHGRQEDAHEFLRYLLESMEKSYLTAMSALRLDNRSKETTPLGQIFGGYIRTEVTCIKCQNISTTFQPLAELQLDIRHSTSVEDAITNHFRKERLDNNDYKCEKCKQICPANKQFSLEIAPIVLCLQLKRFTLFGSKINKSVHANRHLDLTRFLHKSRRAAQPQTVLKYKLAGLVTHIGSSPNCGHYTAIAETSNGSFYQFDDAYVRQVSAQTALNTDAYVIIYELEKSGDGPQAKTPDTTNALSSPYFTQNPKSQINGLIKSQTTSTITSAMLKAASEPLINPLKSPINASFAQDKKKVAIPFLKTPSKAIPNPTPSEDEMLRSGLSKSNGVGLPPGSERPSISFSLSKPEGKGSTSLSPNKLVINNKVNGVLPATASYLTPSARAKYASVNGDPQIQVQKNSTTPPQPRVSKPGSLKSLVPYDDEEDTTGDDDDNSSRKSRSRSRSPSVPRKGIKLFSTSLSSDPGIQTWDGSESKLAKAADQERKRNIVKTEDELYDEEIDLARSNKTKKDRRSSSGEPTSSTDSSHQNKFQVYSDNKKLVNEKLGLLQRGSQNGHKEHNHRDHSSDRHRHHHHGTHGHDRDHHLGHHRDDDRGRGRSSDRDSNSSSNSKFPRFNSAPSFSSQKSNSSISNFPRNNQQQRNTWNRNQHHSSSFRRNYFHPYSKPKFQHKGNGGGNGRFGGNNRRF